jgi:hypothetical protein
MEKNIFNDDISLNVYRGVDNEVTMSLFPIVKNLDLPLPSECAVVEYREGRMGSAKGSQNEKFWDSVAELLETKWYWLGWDSKIYVPREHNPRINAKAASIIAVGFRVIRIILFDVKIESGWSARISHIVMANGKIVKWVDEPDKPNAVKWIVRCYLKALSDQLIRVSAQNAKLLGYSESGVKS